MTWYEQFWYDVCVIRFSAEEERPGIGLLDSSCVDFKTPSTVWALTVFPIASRHFSIRINVVKHSAMSTLLQ